MPKSGGKAEKSKMSFISSQNQYFKKRCSLEALKFQGKTQILQFFFMLSLHFIPLFSNSITLEEVRLLDFALKPNGHFSILLTTVNNDYIFPIFAS